jgi:hypothetical protein
MFLRMKIKLLDVAAFIIALSLILLLSFQVYTETGSQLYVHIITIQGEWFYSLDKEQDLTFTGPVGETKVRISNHQVQVYESDCPAKLCIIKGYINEPGQWIACLPNQIMIKIEGKQESETDAFSY